jgi:exopolyphosphatase / guanosine-5'-triphosphate,3'-diphosphate pyrophosphatase
VSLRLAVLDLGSNSFHGLVADLADGRLHPVAREREMLHLGRVVSQHGALTDEVRVHVVETVAHLAELARRSGATERVAVGTATLRELDDGGELLAELTRAAGTPVRILSGQQEAHLAYLGACSAVTVAPGTALVLDLGGGSLEVASGAGPRVAAAASVPLGVSRLSTLLPSDPATGREVEALVERVDEHLAPLASELTATRPTTAVAVGGTVRALARIVAAGSWSPPTVNMLEIDRDRLTALRDELLDLDLGGRLSMEGMKARRADHLHVAAVILVRVLELLDLPQIIVSDWGLREGVLLDAHGITDPPEPQCLREREVDRVRRALLPHAEDWPHVVTLCERVFAGTYALHRLGEEDRELLRHAARLMDVGRALALRRHQQHGAYLVEHSELKGFAPHEIAMLVTLVRYHTARGIDPSFPPFASLGEGDATRVHKLLPLLQLADGLDRPRDEAVTDLTLQLREGCLSIALLGRDQRVARAELERGARLFSATYGVELELVDRLGA